MTQNQSSAVMQQRREPSDSFDYFPTPLWATRALLEKMDAGISPSDIIREPACGEGHMARALSEKYKNVIASDIQNLGYGSQADYLFPGDDPVCDWTITNPPFNLAAEFILQALAHSRKGVCIFVRSAITEGQGRHEKIFKPYPHSYKYQFVERVILSKGIARDPALKYWCIRSGKWKRPSTATSYCWLVWKRGCNHEPFYRFIEPSRKRLERPGDYDICSATFEKNENQSC